MKCLCIFRFWPLMCFSLHYLYRSSFQFAVCISHDVASLALILPYLAYILFHCLLFFATLSRQFWYLVYVATSGGVAYLFFHFDFLLSWYLVALCHAARLHFCYEAPSFPCFGKGICALQF